MSFRCRQKLKLAGYQAVTELESKTLESGEIVEQVKDLGKEKLPDPELFDLKNQLEAGVDMEEVNSKVMSTKRIDADKVVRKYTKKEKSDVSTDN